MEFAVQIFFIFSKVVRFILTPFFKLFYRKSHKVPPISNNLLQIPAVDLAKLIKRRTVTSEEVVQAYIDRIRLVNPVLNAVTEDRFDDALEDARNADRIAAEKTPEELDEFPFFGVPLTVKESNGLKGLCQCVGIVVKKGDKAEEDGGSTRLLRAAGAIPLCVTNIPEWTLAGDANNRVHGKTSNPHDQSRTCGGSSGGEGALIGAGASLIGTGSDTGGSVRIPSVFCGIFGHKPTPRVVPLAGHFPSTEDETNKIVVVGPMTRYAADLKPMLYVMSDKNQKLRLDEPVSIKNIKIYYKYDFNGVGLLSPGVDKSIKACIRKAVDYFKRIGNSVVESKIDLSNIYYIQMAKKIGVNIAPDLYGYRRKNRERPVLELVKSILGLSNHAPGVLAFFWMKDLHSLASKKKIEKYSLELEALEQQFLDFLGDDGVFIFPTMPTPAFYHNETATLLAMIAYTQLFNFFGFPSTSVPMGYNKEGLPVGFQVVAAPYQDRLCLAVAAELEQGFGGWASPNRVF